MFYKEKIKELREREGIMQKTLASIIGISNTQYCNNENEIELMPLKYLNIICNYFNVSFDYIFNFNNDKQYNNSDNDIDKNIVGNRLKEFRKENKLTQIDLAKMLNIGNGTIADYERGRYLISTSALYTICKKYSISADYLLGKVDEPKYLK